MKKNKDGNKQNWKNFVSRETKMKISFISIAIALCAVLVVFGIINSLGGVSSIFRPCGKIVIASESKSVDGLVSATFERCRYFIVYDLATKKFKAIANPYFSEFNIGDKAAQFIVNRAEEAVISGNIGPLAFQTLESSNIHVYLTPKTSVRNAVKRFLEGKLVHMESSSLFGYTDFQTQPLQRAIATQQVAFNSPLINVQGLRIAFCPHCKLRMPLGSHIRTNKVMCPNCPHQKMQIIGAAENRPMRGQSQQIGFIPGSIFNRNATGRGICVLK